MINCRTTKRNEANFHIEMQDERMYALKSKAKHWHTLLRYLNKKYKTSYKLSDIVACSKIV